MFPEAPRPPRLRVKIHNSNTQKKESRRERRLSFSPAIPLN